jgi:hypothetical protein
VKKKVKRTKQFALEGIEVGGVSSPFPGRMDLVLRMHALDPQGNTTPIEFRVFDKNVDQLLVTVQEGIALYKTMQAQNDA